MSTHGAASNQLLILLCIVQEKQKDYSGICNFDEEHISRKICVIFKKPNILASKGSTCKTAEPGLLENDLQPALLWLMEEQCVS